MQAPGFSADWYRSVTEFAHGTPGWVHTGADIGTDAGLLVFAALFAAAWWRARTRDGRAMTLALLGPVAMVCAFLVNSNIKDVLKEERPCRALPHAMNIATCPGPTDWSFPSNHATIAAGAAAGLLVAWRALTPWVLSLAVLEAFSRVFVGVHYPHDVAAGLLVGLAVASVVSLLAARLLTPLVERIRAWDPVGPLLLGTPAPADGTGPGAQGGPGGYGPGGYGNSGYGQDMPVAGQSHPAGAYGAAPMRNDAAITVPDLPVLDAQGRPVPGRHRRS
ncbi:phosphatase PAP2 family protein [Actinomadura harenae]|uniref:Phosphatase PAP2 family protein n=1 Tax=Actinomadura harenae TaxID=2483351 RepID=A0A3M2M4A4_9ACTN|nr:phosphatase PAP2 family protein [Actinomadura harenae]RMI43275.1 phosphatase PAP2 family protein [Actinomadura harenae]